MHELDLILICSSKRSCMSNHGCTVGAYEVHEDSTMPSRTVVGKMGDEKVPGLQIIIDPHLDLPLRHSEIQQFCQLQSHQTIGINQH